MAYDSPNAEVRRETTQAGIAGVASAAMRKFPFFQATVLKKVHWLVETAGTNASAGFDVYVGTSSVGAVTFGTEVANSFVSSGAINAAVPAGSYVELRGKAASATAVGAVVLEHEVSVDAVKS